MKAFLRFYYVIKEDKHQMQMNTVQSKVLSVTCHLTYFNEKSEQAVGVMTVRLEEIQGKFVLQRCMKEHDPPKQKM